MIYLSAFAAIAILYLYKYDSVNLRVLTDITKDITHSVVTNTDMVGKTGKYTGTIYDLSSSTPKYKATNIRFDWNNMKVASKYDQYKIPKEFKWCHCWD